MDVTCEQCKAEYDFDDTLLGDKGTTVKCSKCGHVFRVLPPRREPTRSALKVRFAHDGSVESIGSLRELQQRIQAGQVSVDDQLGRDGFTFRRLGDVPELKNFFVRSGSSPSGALPVRAASETPARAEAQKRQAAKRTVMGLGPGDIPAAPRMPNLAGLPAAPSAALQAFAPTQPGAANPKATVQGRAPISSAPTAPGLPIPPRDAPSQRVPTSSAPTSAGAVHSASGTAPTVQAPLYGGSPTIPAGPNYTPASSVAKPAANPPVGGPSSGQPAAAVNPPLKLRIPDESVPPGAMKAPPVQPRARALGGDSIGPGALRAATQPQSGQPAAPSTPPRSLSGNPVRLQLDDDDSIPQRGSSGSMLALYAVLLAGLGGAGWFAASKLMGKSGPVTGATSSLPTAAVDASSAVEPALAAAPTPGAEGASDAGALTTTDASAPSAASAPAAPVEPEAAAEQPSPAPSAKSAGKAARSEPREPTDSPSREPKDYSGWVSRGEQLFSRGDIPGAKAAFETAVGLRASGSEANSGLGSVLLGMGQTRDAIPFLSRAASNGFAEASVALGDAHRKLGEKEEAIEAYETYLARLPRGARANYVRLQLEGLGRDSKPQAAPSAAPSEYRPAGEMEAPPAAAPEPREPAPSGGNESETTP